MAGLSQEDKARIRAEWDARVDSASRRNSECYRFIFTDPRLKDGNVLTFDEAGKVVKDFAEILLAQADE